MTFIVLKKYLPSWESLPIENIIPKENEFKNFQTKSEWTNGQEACTKTNMKIKYSDRKL